MTERFSGVAMARLAEEALPLLRNVTELLIIASFPFVF
jgi:hypothetical protein